MTDYTAWCRERMALLAENGVWTVPRSGLTYQKRGSALVLITRMPHRLDIPMPEGEWKDFQDQDYRTTKRHFEKAGFQVRDESQKT